MWQSWAHMAVTMYLILGEKDTGEWTHLANLGTSGGTPEYGNETSGSITGRKIERSAE